MMIKAQKERMSTRVKDTAQYVMVISIMWNSRGSREIFQNSDKVRGSERTGGLKQQCKITKERRKQRRNMGMRRAGPMRF